MKAFVVLFQYSPNGRNDLGEAHAEISDGRLFNTKESACSYVKNKYAELFEKERKCGAEQDEEWALSLTEKDMKDIGYSWANDFSWLSHEFENVAPGEKPEPKFSWRVVEANSADGNV